MAREIVHRCCPTCEACCALRCEIHRETRTVIRFEGDPHDPHGRGYPCPGVALAEIPGTHVAGRIPVEPSRI